MHYNVVRYHHLRPLQQQITLALFPSGDAVVVAGCAALFVIATLCASRRSLSILAAFSIFLACLRCASGTRRTLCTRAVGSGARADRKISLFAEPHCYKIEIVQLRRLLSVIRFINEVIHSALWMSPCNDSRTYGMARNGPVWRPDELHANSNLSPIWGTHAKSTPIGCIVFI